MKLYAFVVSCGDTADVFETSEHAFNDIAPATAHAVECTGLRPVGLVWKHRLGLSPLQPGSPVIGIVALSASNFRASDRRSSSMTTPVMSTFWPIVR